MAEKVAYHIFFCLVGRAGRVFEQRGGALGRPFSAEYPRRGELAGHLAPRAQRQRLEADHDVFGRAGQSVGVLKAEHLGQGRQGQHRVATLRRTRKRRRESLLCLGVRSRP